MRLAAVDIGSNAVRLLFCQVYPTETFPQLKKISLIRLPIRLGEDVFLTGKIAKKNSEKLIKTLVAFKQLLKSLKSKSKNSSASSLGENSGYFISTPLTQYPFFFKNRTK